MTNHNGVLMMQRLLLAGTLGLAVARKAAAILDGESATADPLVQLTLDDQRAPDPRSHDGAVLRAILDAANECLGNFDDRPPGERWCDALLHLLDLASFATDLGAATPYFLPEPTLLSPEPTLLSPEPTLLSPEPTLGNPPVPN